MTSPLKLKWRKFADRTWIANLGGVKCPKPGCGYWFCY